MNTWCFHHFTASKLHLLLPLLHNKNYLACRGQTWSQPVPRALPSINDSSILLRLDAACLFMRVTVLSVCPSVFLTVTSPACRRHMESSACTDVSCSSSTMQPTVCKMFTSLSSPQSGCLYKMQRACVCVCARLSGLCVFGSRMRTGVDISTTHCLRQEAV